MLDVYREQILDRSKNPRYAGELDAPTHQADGENRSCGDEVHIEMIIRDGTIEEIVHSVRSCSVCAAAADLICEELKGKPASELEFWNTERVTEHLGIPLSPIRLKCALLPLETIKMASVNN